MNRFTFTIHRNGRVVVLEGWRAWLALIAALLLFWLFLAIIVFVLVGLAITAGAVLLLILPAALLVFGLHAILGGRRT